jgi:hypothetical protein
MTTFKSVWALAADAPLVPGQPTTVQLKSGQSKDVVVGPLLTTTKDGKHIYYAVPDRD